MRTNVSMSCRRVCLSMNARNGFEPTSSIVAWSILPSIHGVIAVRFTSFSVGAITKPVSSSARPATSCVGGALCVPSA